MRKHILEYFRTLPPESLQAGWEQGSRVLLKRVCKPCQEQLNRNFEIPTHDLLKSMLKGSALTLSTDEQASLAAWFTKTALVLGLARVDRDPDALAADVAEGMRLELVDLLAEGTPPGNVTVRLACMDGDHSLKRSKRPPLPHGWPTPSWYFISSVISATRVIGEVVFWADDDTARRFVAATHDDGRFLAVAPHGIVADAPWPPASTLHVLDIPALRDAWRHPAGQLGGNFPEVDLPRLHRQARRSQG